ncbi:MAG: 30S ribosomal protein S20 [Alphaproteobacteria bacterium]|nr:30S ribosomal protein S20 [Alphaproteobacteria bacterium]
MANIKSAKTRIKRNKKREKINLDRLNAVRTAEKKTRAAVAAGDKEGAKVALKGAESALARAAGKGTMPKKTASRHVSRLAQAVKKLFVG